MNLLQLYNEDCFERFSRLEDGSVDLIVTDPPYAINFTGNTSNTDWDCLTDDQYYDLLCKFLTEAERVLKDSGTIWMCCGVAANCCGRDWIGCEIDPDMYTKANNWIHNYNKELAQEYYKSRIRC